MSVEQSDNIRSEATALLKELRSATSVEICWKDPDGHGRTYLDGSEVGILVQSLNLVVDQPMQRALIGARIALEPFRQEAELILKDAGRGILSDSYLISRAFTFKEWKQAAAIDTGDATEAFCCPFCRSHDVGLRKRGLPPKERVTDIYLCSDCGSEWIDRSGAATPLIPNISKDGDR